MLLERICWETCRKKGGGKQEVFPSLDGVVPCPRCLDSLVGELLPDKSRFLSHG